LFTTPKDVIPAGFETARITPSNESGNVSRL
jgi:hypothetical protein